MTSQDGHAEHQHRLQFRRNDIVRFRKRSQIAKGLGLNLDTLYTVTTHEGPPVVVLRHGRGNHLALMKIPPGHLAVVQRADQIPNEILACAARLAQYDGPISPKTRRLLAELARRS